MKPKWNILKARDYGKLIELTPFLPS